MATMTASEARKKFGQVLSTAQTRPVLILKNGKEAGVVITPDHYRMLLEVYKNRPKVRPEVEAALAESIEKFGSVFAYLAKN